MFEMLNNFWTWLTTSKPGVIVLGLMIILVTIVTSIHFAATINKDYF